MTVPSAIYGQVRTTLDPVSGRPLEEDAILPADVLARTELMRDTVELIRFEMGQPTALASELAAKNVAPRQATYQALSLYRNANQLYMEITGKPGNELAVKLRQNVRPLDVWKIVDAAYERILPVKQQLGIIERIEEKRQDISTTPTAVFAAIAQVNRQLQVLLRNRLSTDDVFQQVTLATRYAARLLEQFPETTPMPDAPAFERGKRPVDVYNLLVRCYARIYAVITSSRLTALKLEAAMPEDGIRHPAEIGPSEVYEVANVLVSELAYLHARLETAEPPASAQDPTVKLPSHVFEKARILYLQLGELEELAKASPDWHIRSH